MGTVGYDPGGWYLIHAGTSLLVITSQFVLRALAIETRYSYPSWLPQVRAYVRYMMLGILPGSAFPVLRRYD